MSKTLITGGNGFIGQELCKDLILSGRKIVKLVRKIRESDNCEQYLCNLGVDKINCNVFDNVDTVFHLAAVTHDYTNKYTSAKDYYNLNVVATKELAISASKNGVKKFIFVSSVKAGGVSRSKKCLTETDQFEPEGIYGITKREAERMLLNIAKKTEMQVSIVRPSLVYGPGVKGNLNSMLKAIDKGWFPPLPENGNKRSMVHIKNVVGAMLSIENSDKSNGEIFILTDKENYSSNQIYRQMCKTLGKKPKSWVVPEFIFFILAKMGSFINIFIKFPFNSYSYQKLLGNECFSSKKIEKMVGFKPKYSLFSDL